VSAVPLKFLASAPRGFGDLLARELIDCGAADSRERSGDVAFTGSAETAYRACLWSRIANRVYLEVAQFEAADADAFLAGPHDLRNGAGARRL
jgi:23S rRNA (guanine2445-N2)-methyltransferase / 23S rRNA (guanine2069-N7)-methyltransferase